MSNGGAGRISPSAHSNHMVQRPQSQQAGSFDGLSPTSPRPESRQGGAAVDRGASPEAPFDSMMDYARLNNRVHQATRSNTFGTPSRLEKRRGDAAGKSETRAMHDIFECGFSKSVQNLGKGIMDEVRAELKMTLTTIRKDVSETLSGLADTRDGAAGDILAQVLKTVEELRVQHQEVKQQLKDQQQPLFEDLHKIEREIADGGIVQLEGRRDLAEKLEERLVRTFDRISEEMKETRLQQERERAAEMAILRQELKKVHTDGAELRAVVCDTVHSLGEMGAQQQRISIVNEDCANEISRLHKEHETHYLDLVPLIQEQRFLRQEVDFSPVLKEVERIAKAVNGDMGTLGEVFSEIGKVQRALNVDYCRAAPDCDTLAVHEGSRFRDYPMQTEDLETVDASTMTVPEAFDKPSRTKKLDDAPKRRVSIVKPDTEAAKKKKPKNVIDGDAMKQKMREALIKGEYNVHDFYFETGFSQKLAKSKTFEHITFLIIFLNGIWIAVDTDYNNASLLVQADPIFQIVENCFCLFFSFELTVRFCAFRKKKYSLKDFWTVFDACLVFLMVLETWVVTAILVATGGQDSSGMGSLSMLRMIRMVKMLRMARMARIMRSVPELVVLIKTIGVAARSVFFFFLFWLIIIYVFGIAFCQGTKGTEVGDLYFDTVSTAMNTLLLDGLLPAQSDFVNELARANPYLWPCIIAFILLASLTVMNMLIGVLVEVVGAVAGTEKEKMSVLGVKHDMRDAMEYLGIDHTQPLTQEQFVNVLMHPEVIHVIQSLGIDPFALVDAADYIFADLEVDAEAGEARSEGRASAGVGASPMGGMPSMGMVVSSGGTSVGLSFESFVDILLKMRGRNPATVKDVKEHTRAMKSMMVKLEDVVKGARKKLTWEIRLLHQVVKHLGGDDADQGFFTEVDNELNRQDSMVGDGDSDGGKSGKKGGQGSESSSTNPYRRGPSFKSPKQSVGLDL